MVLKAGNKYRSTPIFFFVFLQPLLFVDTRAVWSQRHPQMARVEPSGHQTGTPLRAACVCAILALSAMDVPKCRGAAPPLETPFPDWDRGAGEGPTCTVVQDGRS